MSRHDPQFRVRHMLTHAREAIELASSRSRHDLVADRMFNLAMVRLMEIIGETASRVPDDFRVTYPNVPWGRSPTSAIG